MTIQVPEPVGSSGQFLESFIVSSSQHRQVLVLGNSANVAVAPVTTSGGLRVNVTSGVLTLSSMTALSSGIVTLSCVHTVTATAATNPWSSAPDFYVPMVCASSGLVQISGTPTVVLSSIPSLSSGTVTLSSAPLVIVASSGGTIPVTLSTVVSLSSDIALSSGTVTLSSAPLVIVASSGGTIPVTLSTVVSLSSATSLSSGTVTLSSAPLVIVASSGGTIPVTLSTVFSLSSTPTIVSASSGSVVTFESSAQAYSVYMMVTSSAGIFSTAITGVPARLFGYAMFNTNAAARFVKFFNTSSAPTLGTATPVMTILLPGSTAGAGAVQDIAKGITFSAGLAMAITDAMATTSTGSLTAGDVAANVYYV